MERRTPQEVGAPLLQAVQPQQPTPQELLAEINRRSMEGIRAQQEDVDATRARISELKDKGEPINLTPFALAVDMMTGSNTAQQAAALHQQQSQPLRERERLEALLRRQQGALTDDEINMLKTQYQQAKGGGKMSLEDELKMRDDYKRGIMKYNYDLNRKLKQMGFDNKEKTRKAKAAEKAGKPKEFKRDQSNAAGFGRRIEQAEKIFSQLEKEGFNRADRTGALLNYFTPESFESEDFKRQGQAERNFINAALRRESGAAIAPHEFESAERQYFPRAGDSPEVLAQKKANREQTLESLKVGAGEAWDATPLIDPTIDATNIDDYDWDNMSLEEINALGR